MKFRRQASIFLGVMVCLGLAACGERSDSVVSNAAAPLAQPTLVLSVNPDTIALGDAAALQWSSSNASACIASNAWSGDKPLSGAETVAPTEAGTYTYTLTCSGANGSTPATASAVLTVAGPKVVISAKPSTISLGQSSTLTWSSTGVASCTASGSWSGTKDLNGSVVMTPPYVGNYDYTLTCNDADAASSASATATLTVIPPPTVKISADPTRGPPGEASILSWSSTQAVNCTASGAWAGEQPPNGNMAILLPDVGQQTYILSCTGRDGVVRSSDVTVGAYYPLEVLHRFTGTPDGRTPYAALIQAKDGNFYGTTSAGGREQDAGTVYSVTPLGVETVIYPFKGSSFQGNYYGDGAAPTSLVEGTDGYFYVQTALGGDDRDYGSYGTFSKVSANGTATVLHTFNVDLDGLVSHVSPLVQSRDGNFYGFDDSTGSSGITFQLTPTGVFTALAPPSSDGRAPVAGLIQGADGNFYAVTTFGGPHRSETVFDDGVAFKLIPPMSVPNWSSETLYEFDSSQDGNAFHPSGNLIQAHDGNFYGVANGGANGCGSIYKITPSGAETILYSFGGCNKYPVLPDGETSGWNPIGLIQGSDGNFYGITQNGGSVSSDCRQGCGTIFKVTPEGVGTVLYAFTGELSFANAALTQGSDGNLYGTTSGIYTKGANKNFGTVFRLVLPKP